MSEEDYIENRIHVQQKYNSTQSSKLKKRFIILSIIIFISTAIIPIITCFIDVIPLIAKILITAISGFSSVLTGYLSLSKTQELYIEYRVVSEKLKSIEFLYKTKAPPFNNEDAFESLVSICENIIYTGNDKWYSVITETKKK